MIARDSHFVYRSPVRSARKEYGEREPEFAVGTKKLISVTPTSTVVLNVIEVNENIGLMYLSKYSPPGDVGWLQNNAGCHGYRLLAEV
jgi:hypothetical protein